MIDTNRTHRRYDSRTQTDAARRARRWRGRMATREPRVTQALPPNRRRRCAEAIRGARHGAAKKRRWLLDNVRLISDGGEARCASSSRSLARVSQRVAGSRVAARCRASAWWLGGYLDERWNMFSRRGPARRSWTGIRRSRELDMGEIWALKPALQLELLDRAGGSGPTSGRTLVDQPAACGRDAVERPFRSGERGGPRSGARSGRRVCRAWISRAAMRIARRSPRLAEAQPAARNAKWPRWQSRWRVRCAAPPTASVSGAPARACRLLPGRSRPARNWKRRSVPAHALRRRIRDVILRAAQRRSI